MTQVIGEESEGRLTDLAYDTVEPLSWWVPAPVDVLKTAKIKESSDRLTLTNEGSTIIVDRATRRILQLSRDGQKITLDHIVTVHNDAAASYKLDQPESFTYPSLITIKTSKVNATLELSDIHINAAIPAGTLPKAFEDLAK
jgi:hypothetical protein